MVPALGYGEEGSNQVVDSVMGNYQIISSIVFFGHVNARDDLEF